MWRRTVLPFVVVIVTALVSSAGSPAPDMLKVGEKAADFRLTDVVSGSEVGLKETVDAHRLTVVLWVGVECPFSNACNEDYQALHEKYAARGAAFLAINSNSTESAADTRALAESNGFGFPVLYDEGNVIADAFGANFTPELWIIDAEMTARYHGGLIFRGNDKGIQQYFIDAMDALLAGEEPPRTETRAFGCTITRK